jgi:hypothetical protein
MVVDVDGFCIVEINENVEVGSNDQQRNFQLACDFFSTPRVALSSGDQ